MRYALQIIRDVAEAMSEEAREANDRDSAEALCAIGLRIDQCQQALACEWRIVQERRSQQANETLARIAGNLHAACCAQN